MKMSLTEEVCLWAAALENLAGERAALAERAVVELLLADLLVLEARANAPAVRLRYTMADPANIECTVQRQRDVAIRDEVMLEAAVEVRWVDLVKVLLAY